MSKIGKINIAIPEKVKVALNGNLLNVEGFRCSLERTLSRN